MKHVRTFMLAVAMMTLPTITFADSHAEKDDDDAAGVSFGQAGLMSNANREELPTLTLSSGMPLLESGRLTLKSGTYYEIEIEADGSQELALSGAGFFRAIWIDEIVIEGIEIRPMAIDSMEFDDAGTAEISFIAIKPGTYVLQVPGSDLQKVDITIQ